MSEVEESAVPMSEDAVRDLLVNAVDRSFTVRSVPGAGASQLLRERAAVLLALETRPDHIVLIRPEGTASTDGEAAYRSMTEPEFMDVLITHLSPFRAMIQRNTLAGFLAGDDDLRDHLHQRYRRLLLDCPSSEMVEIADALTKGGAGGSVVVVNPSGPLVVGEEVELRANYRSVPDIVDLDPRLGSPRRRPRPEGDPGVIRTNAVGDPAGLARIVRSLIENEVEVRRQGWWEPASLDDIAIVLPAATRFGPLNRAFESVGIPVVPASEQVLAETEEARLFETVAQAIGEDPSTGAVVGILRSGVFAISDGDLVTWVQAGGSWDLEDQAPPELADHAVAHAVAQLRAWRHLPLPEALEAALDHGFLRSQAVALPGGDQRLSRSEWLLDRAWLELEGLESPMLPRAHGVRVLTIDDLSGLEFPIVIAAMSDEVNYEVASRARDLLVIAGDAGVNDVRTDSSERAMEDGRADSRAPKQLALPSTSLAERLARWERDQETVRIRNNDPI